MRILMPLVIFVVFGAASGRAQDDQVRESSNVKEVQINSGWLSAETGVQHLSYTYWPSETAAWGSFSFRLPVGSRVALMLLYEQTLRSGPYKSFGGGIEVAILRTGEFDLLPAISLFTDNREDTGFLISLTPAYKILDGWMRLQTTLGYRIGGEFDMGGGNSVSAFSVSAGVGLSINRLVGRPQK